MKRVHMVISGDVQGVGFRAWIRGKAKSIGLGGWMKNREEGSVYVYQLGVLLDCDDASVRSKIAGCLQRHTAKGQSVLQYVFEYLADRAKYY